MKRLDVGMVVMHGGRPAMVDAIGEGRHVHLRFLDVEPCPACGTYPGVSGMESSPLIQDRLEPVKTVAS
jgi:hypothetical protein